MLDFLKIPSSVRFLAGQTVKNRWEWMQRVIRLVGEPVMSDEDVYLCGGMEITITIRIEHDGPLTVFQVQLCIPDPTNKPNTIEAKVWESSSPGTSKLQPDGFFKVISDFRATTPEEAANLLIEHWPIIEVMDC